MPRDLSAAAMISPELVRVLAVFQAKPAEWFGTAAVAVAAGVGGRTARDHTARLAGAGVLERSPRFHNAGHRYKLAAEPTALGLAYLGRLAAAREQLGHAATPPAMMPQA